MPTDPDSSTDSVEPDLVQDADGAWVMSRGALLRRGSCCGLGCRNCPYVGTAAEHPDRARNVAARQARGSN